MRTLYLPDGKMECVFHDGGFLRLVEEYMGRDTRLYIEDMLRRAKEEERAKVEYEFAIAEEREGY